MVWVSNVRCDNCGARHPVAPSASWANAFRDEYPCWKCGSTDYYNWSNVTEKWVSHAIWWKPWTWNTGHWEGKT